MEFIKIRFPTVDENLMAIKAAEAKYDECTDNGIVTKERMEIYLKKYKIFTPQMEEEMKNIEEGDYFKYRRDERLGGDKESINKYVENCIIEIINGYTLISPQELLEPMSHFPKDPNFERFQELATLKNTYIRLTREGFANLEKSRMLAFFCSYNAQTNKRLFNSYEEFLSDSRANLAMALMARASDFFSGLPITTMRFLARHPLWRTKWISSTKIGQDVFRGRISEWDINKSYLCYWSNFYDNVYNAYEPPEEYVIEKDDMLDQWLEQKKRERERQHKGQGNSSEDGNVYLMNRVKVNPVKKK